MKVINLSSLDGSNGFRLNGVTEGDLTGASVSTAGDVNGDGFDDVIVTTHHPEGHGFDIFDVVSSYVVFGKASHRAETRQVADVKGGTTWLVNPGTVAGLAGPATWVLADLAEMR